MDVPPPIHILMRFSDRQHGENDVVSEHQKVIMHYKAVWFGRLSKPPLSQRHIDKIGRQREEDIPSYLYLVQRGYPGAQEGARGNIIEITRSFPTGGKKLIPKYYFEGGLIDQIQLWLKLSNLVTLEKGELANLRVVATRSRVPNALSQSMAPMFIVQEA